jgi:catechol 2,3-dioxygenase-like lactoylglutathione lyase family enzyme
MSADSPEPDLVPELLVTDLGRSLDFWCQTCGFSIRYDRRDEGFAYVARGSAHVMLEELGVSRNWVPGVLDKPYGRGINFQIAVDAIAPILERLAGREWSLFMEPEEKWYRTDDGAVGVRQFLVQDPDGYLVRFSEHLGRREQPITVRTPSVECTRS